MQAFLKRALWWSFGIAIAASIAGYALIFGLATIHEELNLSPDSAWPVAIWTFPIVFLGSLVRAFWQRAAKRRS